MNKNNSNIHHNYLLFIIYHPRRNIIKTENYFIFINNFKKYTDDVKTINNL